MGLVYQDQKELLIGAIEACREMVQAVDKVRKTFPDLVDTCNEIIKYERIEVRELTDKLVEIKREHAKSLSKE